MTRAAPNPRESTPALLLTVQEAAETLRCRRSKIFSLIAKGVLVKAPRFGRQTCVHAESVFAALEKTYDPPAPKKRVRRTGRAQFEAQLDAVLAEVRAR